jgi:hypothetical protein
MKSDERKDRSKQQTFNFYYTIFNSKMIIRKLSIAGPIYFRIPEIYVNEIQVKDTFGKCENKKSSEFDPIAFIEY